MTASELFNFYVAPIESSEHWQLKILANKFCVRTGEYGRFVTVKPDEIFNGGVRFAIKCELVQPSSDHRAWNFSVDMIFEKAVSGVIIIDRIEPGVFCGTYTDSSHSQLTNEKLKFILNSNLSAALDHSIDSLATVLTKRFYKLESMNDKQLVLKNNLLQRILNKSWLKSLVEFRLLSQIASCAVFLGIVVVALTLLQQSKATANETPELPSNVASQMAFDDRANVKNIQIVQPVQSTVATKKDDLTAFMNASRNEASSPSENDDATQQVKLVKQTLKSMGFDVSKQTDTGCLVN